jgi:RecB family exonuclease
MALDYISYSQFHTYTSCPRSWYLSKLRNAEARQTWYIPVGSAVHNMIEDYLQEEYESADQFRVENYFYPLIEKQLLIEPDMGKWLAGGPKAAPVIAEKALKLVQECFEKALEYLDEIDVWEVEYDASGRLPGLSVPIKAYVDIIGEHKKQGPVIWDWKTGSTKPGNFQLETYASLLMVDNPWDPALNWHGRYVMLAPGKPVTRHVDLSKVDPAEVGKKYQKVYDRMQEKYYEAKAGFDCGFCFNQDNCLVNAGMTKRATYYDRSEEDGVPF